MSEIIFKKADYNYDTLKIIGFDYDRCIRCYCGVEVCPHGALSARETKPGKLIRKLSRIRSQQP
jgi:formate hydrogenlyase subunit 6/NADH:ubiquinone oxidoreductase subunit I